MHRRQALQKRFRAAVRPKRTWKVSLLLSGVSWTSTMDAVVCTCPDTLCPPISSPILADLGLETTAIAVVKQAARRGELYPYMAHAQPDPKPTAWTN